MAPIGKTNGGCARGIVLAVESAALTIRADVVRIFAHLFPKVVIPFEVFEDVRSFCPIDSSGMRIPGSEDGSSDSQTIRLTLTHNKVSTSSSAARCDECVVRW